MMGVIFHFEEEILFLTYTGNFSILLNVFSTNSDLGILFRFIILEIHIW